MSNFVGQTLLSQYYIRKIIAVGGNGTVYLAWDSKRATPLAIKVLPKRDDIAPDLLHEYLRLLDLLQHPNIVRVYGVEQIEGQILIIEEYIDGQNLREALQEHKEPIRLDEAIRYLDPLCSALRYSHSNGILHLDIKPSNVLLGTNRNVFLTDFGISGQVENNLLGITGMPAYMAPEQIRGEAVTAATDIYSLGVMTYEMLTGQRPFLGNDPISENKGVTVNERIRFEHLYLPVPDPCFVNPSIPVKVGNVIAKALSKEQKVRFHGTREFLEAFRDAAGVVTEKSSDHVSSTGSHPLFHAPLRIAGDSTTDAPPPDIKKKKRK